jgi:transposase InsO family protein
MPWRKTTVLDDRMQFMSSYLSGDWSFADLCRAFGISRKTGYKFVARCAEEGPAGLHDASRAAHTYPNMTPAHLQDAIVDFRNLHPTWGPRKLRVVLERDKPEIAWPAPSTIGTILKLHGLSVPRKRRRPCSSPSLPLSQPGAPNEVWCADFKGHFALGNGRRCTPFTITDAYSRSLLRCQALEHTDSGSVRPLWVAAFREYGLPTVIRTDNGPPFASQGLGGLSTLALWWIKLGIRPERIKPGHPEQNGQHERMHRTLKADAVSPPKADMRSQQRALDHFRQEYNHLRPHEALGQQTPASIYTPSPRPYPLRLPEVEYPAGVLVRRVRTNGYIRLRGSMIFLSEVLVGEPVGLDQLDDRYWAVYFGPLPLAIFDDHTNSWLQQKAAAKRIQTLLEEQQL